MPDRETIHKFIRDHNFADEDDAKDYFYQFPLDKNIQPYFATRIEGVGVCQLTRLCMGWRTSMAIAQSASNLLCRAVNNDVTSPDIKAHADNFILGASTKEEFHNLISEWKKVMQQANIPTKRMEELKPRQSLHWLGLLIDLQHKTIRAKPDSISKLKRAFQIMSQEGATFRQIFKIFGASNYARHMMGIPLFRYRFFMSWFARKATMLHLHPDRWDQKADIPISALRDLRKMINDIGKPTEVKQKMHKTIDLWTDASTYGGGYMILGTRPERHAWEWSHREKEAPIHRLEAIALLRGVEATIRSTAEPVEIIGYCDNQVVVHCWDRYRARDPSLAKILDQIYNILRRSDFILTTKWVPSEEQKADYLSRLFQPSRSDAASKRDMNGVASSTRTNPHTKPKKHDNLMSEANGGSVSWADCVRKSMRV